MYKLNPLLESTRWKKELINGTLSDKAIERLRLLGIYNPYRFINGNIKGRMNQISRSGLKMPIIANTAAGIPFSGTVPFIDGLSNSNGVKKELRNRFGNSKAFGGQIFVPLPDTKMRNIQGSIYPSTQIFDRITKPSRSLITAHELDEYISSQKLSKDPKFRKIVAGFIKKCRSKGMSREEIQKEFSKIFSNPKLTGNHYPGVLKKERKFRNQIKPLLKRSGIDPDIGLSRRIVIDKNSGNIIGNVQFARSKVDLNAEKVPLKKDISRRLKSLETYQ